MPLHPQVKGLLDNVAASGIPPFHQMTPESCRATFKQLFGALPPSTAKIAGTKDIKIPGPAGAIPARVYTPEGKGPFPVLVYMHGGGWVIGDIEGYENVCRELCGGSQAVVVSLDYRLGPEHKFPAATDDCLAAVRWVGEHAAEIGADAKRIAVGGDSAGGNLAAVTALRLRDEGGPRLAAQLLIYPVTDHYTKNTVSMVKNAEGFLLTRQDMVWFSDYYLRTEADVKNPHFAPLRAKSLAGLAPALVLTAEFDPLCDEGEEYAARLKDAGVPTKLSRYDGAIHGFFGFFSVLDLGRAGMDESCRWLKERFAA
ncbi:MAG: alpha/beta hydrolase [Nevskia sp.]|nr:alpha/beta hydrolase [Nevskia sp.]